MAARLRNFLRASGSASRWPRPASSKIFPRPRKFLSASGSSNRWPRPAFSKSSFRPRNLRRASGSSRRWPRPAFSKSRLRPAISASRCLSLASISSALACESASCFVRSSSCFLYWSAETPSSDAISRFLPRMSAMRVARVCSSSSKRRFAAFISSSEGMGPRIVCFQTLSFLSATEVLQTTFVKTLSTVIRLETYGSCAW
mmetsp:Transcript_59749/g.175284  ORF Transcript_59749/g.175284 Transcript_59749/m.175284 type:complete len:201 (-) Transcript_59749:859-1461(-)